MSNRPLEFGIWFRTGVDLGALANRPQSNLADDTKGVWGRGLWPETRRGGCCLRGEERRSYEDYERLRKEAQERLAVKAKGQGNFTVKRMLMALHD